MFIWDTLTAVDAHHYLKFSYAIKASKFSLSTSVKHSVHVFCSMKVIGVRWIYGKGSVRKLGVFKVTFNISAWNAR